MLDQLPEEILDRIIYLSLSNTVSLNAASSSPGSSPRPAWHTRPSPHLAILLTSHRFLRIATHYVYNTIHLATRTQARLLHSTLENNPSLAKHIHSLTMLGVWPEGGLIMGICKDAVRYLDINLERFSETGPVDREYGDGLSELVGVRHLTVRKPFHVYQSLPRLRYIIIALAKAIERWRELVGHYSINKLFIKFALPFRKQPTSHSSSQMTRRRPLSYHPPPSFPPFPSFTLPLFRSTRPPIHRQRPYNMVLLLDSAQR